MTHDHTKWIYHNDEEKHSRYVLGTIGEHPLVCFGINPSTAKPGDLDNTLKSVERLATNNGYDSYIMLNIYPQRATQPKDIHKEIDMDLHRKNLDHIEAILQKGKLDIWAAWGTLIEKREYFHQCLIDIYEISQKYKSRWLSIGKTTKAGHPHHPLYLRKTEKTELFDMEGYISILK